jgi:hypothetical protein
MPWSDKKVAEERAKAEAEEEERRQKALRIAEQGKDEADAKKWAAARTAARKRGGG